MPFGAVQMRNGRAAGVVGTDRLKPINLRDGGTRGTASERPSRAIRR